MRSGLNARIALFLGMAIALAAGCASRGVPTASVEQGENNAERGSWLFRAELDGAAGGGSVRLTLRRFDAATFDLAAADVMGQARWRLLVADGEAIWIDRSRERFCRLAASRGLPASELRTVLRIGDLPALLLRELPRSDGALPAEGHAELEDELGRRYSGERAAGVWRSWTLRIEGRPALWYRLGGDGGGGASGATLSGRDPAFVLRWRETAHGELGPGESLELAPPKGFAEEICSDAAPA